LATEEVVVEDVEEPAKSAVSESAFALEQKMAELEKDGVYGQEALVQLQPFFDEIGSVVKTGVEPKGEVGNIANIIRSTLKDEVATLKQEIVAEVVKELSGYVTTSSPAPSLTETPVSRSLVVKRNDITPQGKDERTQMQKIADASVGLK